MSTKDLHIFESGSGGEISIKNDDLVMSESLFTLIYISLFGGNYEAETTGNEVSGQERFDYWANDLIFKNFKGKQYNSLTERTLNEVALNSSGRLKIESAVNQDLSSIKEIANLTIFVSIVSESEVLIKVSLESLQNQSERAFEFLWNNAAKQLIKQEII